MAREFGKKLTKKVDTLGRKAGMSWNQRRKLKKGLKNFGYDVAVDSVSSLLVTGVTTTAYYTGKGVVKLGSTTVSAVKNGIKSVKGKKASKEAENQLIRDAGQEILRKLKEEGVEMSQKDIKQLYKNIDGNLDMADDLEELIGLTLSMYMVEEEEEDEEVEEVEETTTTSSSPKKK